ncbi:hypothetical protein CYMTET_18540 [Cymbomonas tetramitiformis]|uniref:Protein Red n=1 Tax=Cymbomonas tetramitiformis TaxID=36881 RepID=A0AAE0G882_9CHLO|nr:hypothetical protein CYMTET_18540 [Cymbomonas tetramitiformis]
MGDIEGYSNPLPPPPRPGGGNVEPETPLRNSDFRKFLDGSSRGETPRFQKSTPRAGGGSSGGGGDQDAKKKKKWRPQKKESEEEKEQYRDRAKERREGINPDYSGIEESVSTLSAVAPPGANSIMPPEQSAELHRQAIENSKYLGGDVEHTHLVKGLDFALLQKVRVELSQKDTDVDDELEDQLKDPGKAKPEKTKKEPEKLKLQFRTAQAKAVHDILTGTQRRTISPKEMFQFGRTAYVYDLEDEYAQDIPTTQIKSKADCPIFQEHLQGATDTLVLERLSKIMTYLRLGSAGKGRKMKKKEKAALLLEANAARTELFEASKPKQDRGKHVKEEPVVEIAATREKGGDDDIFGDVGTNYDDPTEEPTPKAKKPVVPKELEDEPMQGPTMPPRMSQSLPPPPPPPPGGLPPPPPDHQQAYGMQWGGQAQGQQTQDWVSHLAAQGVHQTVDVYGNAIFMDAYGQQVDPNAYMQAAVAYQAAADPAYQALLARQQQLAQEVVNPDDELALGGLTQSDKEAGLGSVFKRNDEEMQARRETDAREKEASFVSETYSECYPGYQEYNAEVMSDEEEEDLTQMDMGRNRGKGPHRTDFENEEDWARYNEKREAMPRAAFQFGIKMADGRRSRKQKDQKLSNQLNRINQMIKTKREEDSKDGIAGGMKLFDMDDDGPSTKRSRKI